MLIKVCGLREADNIRAVENVAAPDWAGFIFYPKSPRFVSEPPAYLPCCPRIGVFVSPTEDYVLQRVKDYNLWGVQLYVVTPDFCRKLRSYGLHIIVAISAKDNLDHLTAPFFDCADHFLFDTPTAGYGGSGCSFDHSILYTYQGVVPFLLSGGLNPQSLPAIRSIRHPRFDGIDLNSGFEIAPAVKDPTALQTLIHAIRHSY